MILQVFETMFILLTAIMVVYLVRHYVFTLTALRRAKNTTEAARNTYRTAGIAADP